jgi:ABC-type transport system substrate-binding protein
MLRRVVVLLLVALAVCEESGAARRAGGTFTVAEPATYIDSIDAAVGGLAGDVPFESLACASLLRFADKSLPAGFRLVPELATAFPDVSRDTKTYTFRIRRGLRFSTGAPVTAADVAFTIDRLLRLRSPSSEGFAGIVGAQAVLAGTARRAAGIAVSGQRLRIRLVRPDGGFVANGAASLCVVPAGTQSQPGGLTPPIPSAAPYYISEYVPGQRIVLDRNTYYRGSRPRKVDRFVFDLSVDDNQALDEVLAGSADYAWVPESDYASRDAELARRFGVNRARFFVEPGTFLRLFFFNTTRPLFRDNAPLRRAINLALDRDSLVGQLGAYTAVAADHYLLPIMPGYDRVQLYPAKPQLAAARRLAAGHTRGGKLVLYVNDRPGLPAVAQVVKLDLARIGLDVEVHVFPGGTLYFQKLANPKTPFDMAWSGLSILAPDPGSLLGGLFDGATIGKPGNLNFSYFDSPKWNSALRNAAMLTGAARDRAFGRLDVALARDEAPAAAWAIDNTQTLVSARTGCVIANPYLDLAAVCLK